MSRPLRVLAPVLIVAIGVVIAVAINKAKPEPEAVKPETVPPAVRVIETRSGTHRFVVRSQGTVSPRTEISLVAEVGGRVIAVDPSFEDGGFFEPGDVLVEIDPTDYRLALTRAKAAVKEAELNLAVQRADADVAREEWQRLEGEEPPPLVAREPQVARAEAALEAARAQVESAERDLARTRVTAPFAGRVRSAAVDAGQVVSRGTVLGSIYAIDYAQVRLPLATDDLGYVHLPMGYRDAVARDGAGDGTGTGDGRGADAGPPVRLSARLAGERHTWSGRVVRTDGAVDPTTRRLGVTARVDDPYGQSAERPDRPPLAVGLFVDAAIDGRVVENVFVIPRAALRTGDRVYVVDGEDRLRVRDAKVLRKTREQVVISEGLEDGGRVVISSMETAIDGMRVRPEMSEPVSGSEQ